MLLNRQGYRLERCNRSLKIEAALFNDIISQALEKVRLTIENYGPEVSPFLSD
jgi:hypothetical protein